MNHTLHRPAHGAARNGHLRVITNSRFGPTLESESLPVLGESRERHNYRARVLRLTVCAVIGFWLGAGATALMLLG